MTATEVEARTCIICSCGVVPKHAFARATPEQRAVWAQQGVRSGARVDMCGTCNMRLRRNGQLDQYPTKVHRMNAAEVDETNPWVHCIRCGVEDQHTGRLCADCVETVARMGERDRWVA